MIGVANLFFLNIFFVLTTHQDYFNHLSTQEVLATVSQGELVVHTIYMETHYL